MTNRFKAARQNTEFTHNDVNSDVKENMSYCQIWCMAFRPLSLLIARLPVCHL